MTISRRKAILGGLASIFGTGVIGTEETPESNRLLEKSEFEPQINEIIENLQSLIKKIDDLYITLQQKDLLPQRKRYYASQLIQLFEDFKKIQANYNRIFPSVEQYLQSAKEPISEQDKIQKLFFKAYEDLKNAEQKIYQVNNFINFKVKPKEV